MPLEEEMVDVAPQRPLRLPDDQDPGPAAGEAAVEVRPGGDVRQPVFKRVPYEPTPAERELHDLTHLPFRSWCGRCVRSKAKEDGHVTVQRPEGEPEFPEVQMDYHFLGSEKHPSEPTLTLLTIKLVGTGAVHSILGHKGVSGYMVAAVSSALEVWGLDKIVLKTDQEPSIIALGSEIAEFRRPRGTICRTVPRESHASLGAG